jgi:hypothetical protein
MPDHVRITGTKRESIELFPGSDDGAVVDIHLEGKEILRLGPHAAAELVAFIADQGGLFPTRGGPVWPIQVRVVGLDPLERTGDRVDFRAETVVSFPSTAVSEGDSLTGQIRLAFSSPAWHQMDEQFRGPRPVDEDSTRRDERLRIAALLEQNRDTIADHVAGSPEMIDLVGFLLRLDQ